MATGPDEVNQQALSFLLFAFGLYLQHRLRQISLEFYFVYFQIFFLENCLRGREMA